MKQQIEKITPKIAAEYMQFISSDKQRRLMPKVVKSYANAMRGGQWILTHQGIAFDDKGNLIDGQHRLAAVIQSGVTIEIPVAYDLPSKADAALNVIDSGRIRGIGEHLTVQYGYRGNGNIMAAAAAMVQSICYSSKIASTVPATLKIIDLYNEELNYCWKNISEMRSLKSGMVMGASAFAMKGMVKAKFKEFYLGLMTGENLTEAHPALTLRNFLLEGQHIGRSGGHSSRVAIRRAVCQCAMHYQVGNSLRVIKPTNQGIEFFAERQKDTVIEVRKAIGLKEEELLENIGNESEQKAA